MNALYFVFPLFLAILAAILLGQMLHGYLLLRRMRLGPGGSEPAERAEVPADLRLILDEAAPALAALGFEYLDSRRILPVIRHGDPSPSYGDRWVHPESGAHVLVQPAELPEPGATAAVSFSSFCADGSVLLTLNRREHLFVPLPPVYRVADGYLPDLAAQWELHRQRLAGVEVEAIADGVELDRREEALRQETDHFWQASGVVAPAEEGLWQLSRHAAFNLLRRMMRGNRRLAKLPRRAAAAEDEALLAADLRAYRANEAVLGQGALRGNGKVVLFGLSAVAGILAFGLLLGWEIVPALVGVLLFHEFGHALAMRLMGYRNLQVMMIPLLGAVAMGRKDDAGPWTKLVVLLAGPLPGLLLAVACFHALPAQGAPPEWLLQLAVVALVLNLFNLLPVTPLDGGQIVEAFLFARWPRLRFFFYLASILALGALGLRMESQVLPVLALLLLMGIGGLWRRLGVAAKVGQVTPEEAPGALFAALYRSPALANRGFQLRFRTVRAILPLVLARPPRLWESLAGLAIYAAVVVAPFYALPEQVPAREILTSLIEPKSPREAPPPPDWEALLAKAETPEQRWQLLMEAGSWLEDEAEEVEPAHRRYTQALEIAQGFPADDPRRFDSRIALARTAPADGALEQYRALLPELRALQGTARVRLAEVLEAMHWLDRQAAPEAKIALLREAIAVREALSEDDPYAIVRDREDIAKLLYLEGDKAAAETELRRNLAQLPLPGQVESLAWLLIDTGRAEEALALIDGHRPTSDAWQEGQLEQTGAWSLLALGDRDQARRALEALIERLPRRLQWQGALLRLDLTHLEEGERLVRRIEEARREIAAYPGGAASVRSYLRSQRETAPWEQLRTEARLVVLNKLGLPEQTATCRK